MAYPFQMTTGSPASIFLNPAASSPLAGPHNGYAPAQVANADLVGLDKNLAFQREKLGQDTANAAAERAVQQQIGMAPWDYKNKVFGTISPLLSGLMGGAGTGVNPGGVVGGQNLPAERVGETGVWSPQMVDQQVNQAKANNAQQAGTQMRGMAAKTAAQGFGSKSPLLAALQGNIGQAQMAGDAAAEQGIRWNAAQGNAANVQKAQVANQGADLQLNNADIERRKANNQFTTSLLSVLSGMA